MLSAYVIDVKWGIRWQSFFLRNKSKLIRVLAYTLSCLHLEYFSDIQ